MVLRTHAFLSEHMHFFTSSWSLPSSSWLMGIRTYTSVHHYYHYNHGMIALCERNSLDCVVYYKYLQAFDAGLKIYRFWVHQTWVCCQLQSYRVNQIDRAVDKQVTMSPAPFILIQCALPQLPVDAKLLTTQYISHIPCQCEILSHITMW